MRIKAGKNVVYKLYESLSLMPNLNIWSFLIHLSVLFNEVVATDGWNEIENFLVQ